MSVLDAGRRNMASGIRVALAFARPLHSRFAEESHRCLSVALAKPFPGRFAQVVHRSSAHILANLAKPLPGRFAEVPRTLSFSHAAWKQAQRQQLYTFTHNSSGKQFSDMAQSARHAPDKTLTIDLWSDL